WSIARGEGLFSVIHGAIGLIAHFDAIAAFAVFVGVRLSLNAHTLNLLGRKARRSRQRDVLRTASGFIQGSDLQDAVNVDIESHFYLWDAAWRGRDAIKDKVAQRFVIGHH